jgi:hypothetical protein
MDNNATIGQAAGPLIAFDDTNNYLEITGCNVGIGTTTPSANLQVFKQTAANIRVSANATGAYYAELYSNWDNADLGGVKTGVGNLIRYNSDLSSTYVGLNDAGRRRRGMRLM